MCLHPHRNRTRGRSTLSHSKWKLRGKNFARYTHTVGMSQEHKRPGRTKSLQGTHSFLDMQGLHRRSSKTM